MLSLFLWLLVPRYPGVAGLALAYGLFLTYRLLLTTGEGCFYYLLVQLAALALLKWPKRPQSSILWGYLAAVYPAASGSTLVGSAPGIVALLVVVGLTRLRPPLLLAGAAACAASLAYLEHQALAGWLIPPPIHLTLDPLDALLPIPSLATFALCCLLLQPGRARHLGPLLYAGACLSPLPLPWVLLTAALVAARDRRATIVLVALGLAISAGSWVYLLKGGTLREYRLTQLEKGQVLTAQELALLLPDDKLERGHVKFPKFARLAVTEEVAATPDWMLYSNNPEMVDSPGNLYRGMLPAGTGRVFISHFNTHPPPAQLRLTLRNPGAQNATVTTSRKVWFDRLVPDAGTEMLRAYLSSQARETVTIPAGGSHQEGLDNLLGNGLCMADLTLDRPLEATVSMMTSPGDVGGPVKALLSSQSRGLFLKPDRILKARVELGSEMLACEPLAQHLKGLDGTRIDELKGSYGALETVDFEFTGPALVLLIPRAGYLGAVLDGRTYAINPYGALVLASIQQPGRWQWTYSLPANSFAPNCLLIVPVR